MKEPIAPMLATLVAEPFDRPGWVHEEKYDGYRAIAYRRAGRIRIYSRNAKSLTGDFPDIARALEGLSGGDFVLDGEIVALDAKKVSRFQLLQRRSVEHTIRPIFAIFDCLESGGRELLRRPLKERRRELEAIVPAGTGLLRRSRRLSRSGLAAYAFAREKGWEGILSKNEASVYEPGVRSGNWLKVKVRHESEFVIGGFTSPGGSRTHFGALLVGLYDGARLRYAGKIGSGYSDRALSDLAGRMAPRGIAESPFEPAPREKGAHWVRADLVVQVAFAEWTAEGKLRQPVFLGLRSDKKARECRWSEREK
jgi:bifunctional non-homologous end joining protein LigD